MEQTDILSLSLAELESCMKEMGQPKFRAKQIFSWLHQKQVTSFAEMTSLSLQLREKLQEKFCINRLNIARRLASSIDDTVKYLYELPDGNFVETVIGLPPNLFYGTGIAVNILVLSRHKADTKTQFIDASGEDFFKKQTNNNVLTDEHIERIVDIFDRKEPVEYVAALVDNSKIAENGYNLSVSSYVEAKDTREVIDIARLNAEVKQTVERIDALRADIDAIIKELEDE